MSELPKCVYFKHGSYYLVKQGKWHFLTKDRDAINEQLQIRFGFVGGNVPSRWKEHLEHSELQQYLLKVLARAKQNAKGRRVREFSLTETEALSLLEDAKYRCSVTGVPFSLKNQSADGKRPYAPSIDRIDNAIGYVSGNCRVVCMAANIAMNTWGAEVLMTMLRYARKRKVLDSVQNSKTSY